MAMQNLSDMDQELKNQHPLTSGVYFMVSI